MVVGFLADIALLLTATLTGELLLIATIKEDPGGYKIRPAEWFREGNLEHYQKFIVVAALALTLLLITSYIFSKILFTMIYGIFETWSPLSATLYNAMLFLVVLSIGTYYTRGKNPDKNLAKIAILAILLLLAFVQLEYNLFDNLT